MPKKQVFSASIHKQGRTISSNLLLKRTRLGQPKGPFFEARIISSSHKPLQVQVLCARF